MRLSRAERSLLSDWWFSIDRMLLAAVLLLMLAGLVFSFAAGPAAAERLELDELHFVKRHALTLIPAVMLLICVSMLSPKQLRRLSLILVMAGLAAMAAALLQGVEKNGAARWLFVSGVSFQPSEFVKPGFVVLTAWLFAEAMQREDVPATGIAASLLLIFVGLLVVQPDIGQAVLIVLTWGALFFAAGYPLRWMLALVGLFAVGLILAYFAVPHVTERVDAFLSPQMHPGDQTALALSAFADGGWFGRGPGEGVIKSRVPDSHNDYVFAVIAEELGIVACLLLVAVYGFIIWRVFTAALREPSPFIRLAASGLLMLFGFQAVINMAVNVNLLPAKGMTLPFISYGGSSLLSMSVTMAMILGLTRRRPLGESLSRFREAVGIDADAGAASARGI